jgi:hypothetical protein
MQPELWRDVAVGLFPVSLPDIRRFAERLAHVAEQGRLLEVQAKRVLMRAQGGLHGLTLSGEALACPLWDGAIQDACSRGTLASVALSSYSLHNQKLSQEQVDRLVETVGSCSLRSLVLSSYLQDKSPATQLARGIVERSVHLRELHLSIPDDFDTLPLSASWDEKGLRPLYQLEKLSISSLSPWLWEHISRLGVKLRSVALTSSKYNSFKFEARSDSCGSVLQHLLDVLSGPHLQHFEYRTSDLSAFGDTGVHPSIQTAVFEYPRRSLAFHNLRTDAGIGSTLLLEELELVKCREHSLNILLSQSFPRLRNLTLNRFSMGDAILAQALHRVARMLESLQIVDWNDRAPAPVETLSAIAALHSLRSLKLEYCRGLTHAMLEPLLIGNPPSHPPLCRNVHTAHIQLHERFPEFIVRLRESIQQRFPDTPDNCVTGS